MNNLEIIIKELEEIICAYMSNPEELILKRCAQNLLKKLNLEEGEVKIGDIEAFIHFYNETQLDEGHSEKVINDEDLDRFMETLEPNSDS